MKKGKTFMFLNVKRVVNITALSFLLATSISYAKDKEETLTLATFPTYEEFHQKDLEHFTLAMVGKLSKQGFDKEDFGDIVEMFIGAKDATEVDEIKDDIKSIYGKKITTDSKLIFYNIPSFERYENKISGLLDPETNKNINGDDIINLAKRIEKNNKGHKKFIADLYELGESYKEIAESKKEIAESKKEIAESKKEIAQGRKINEALRNIQKSLEKNFGK